jgi:hypothetical protein
LEIEPDYGMSWERLYTSLAKQFICKSRHLGQLGGVTQCSATQLCLPTWVPDWRQPHPSSRVSRPEHSDRPRQYYASGSSRVVLTHHEDPARLQLRGLRCDEVGRISLSKVEINDFLTHNHLRSTEIFYGELTSFMTSGGLLGFGPRHLKVGDHIFVFLGGEVPHLLRKTDAETEYAFVGECHVHGLMKGEALLKARKMADPKYDLGDTEWLDQLHEGEIPFPTEEVVIR